MKRSDTQLTVAERYHQYTMQKQNKSIREIAKGMGRSHTTLSRELTWNTCQKGFRYQQTQNNGGLLRHTEKPKAVKLNQGNIQFQHSGALMG